MIRTNIKTQLPRARAVIIVGALLSVGIVSLAVLLNANSNNALAAKPNPTPSTVKALPPVNLDSLYEAKADEPSDNDTSYAEVIAPDNEVNGSISWYGPGFHGRRTASGEIFNKNMLSAAHKTLPFGTLIRVVDKVSGKSVLVRVNDRGPYVGSRVLDVSEEAARHIKLFGKGTTSARLEIFSATRMAAIAKDPNAVLSFDASWRMVRLHGYSVVVAQTGSLEQAAETAQKLREDGNEQVFISRMRSGGAMMYNVSVGLFDSERAGEGMLADLNDSYKSSRLVRFDRGDMKKLDTTVSSDSTQQNAE